MKTKLFVLIAALLCLSLMFVSCDDEHTTHIDENNDAKCDVCETAVPCGVEHIDENKDLACDRCAATLPAPCDPHVDADADLVCDSCGKAVVVIETQTPPPAAGDKVEMVVNPIPADAAIADYLVNGDVTEYLTAISSIDNKWVERFGQLALIKTLTGEGSARTQTYSLKNIVTGESFDIVKDLNTDKFSVMTTRYNGYYRVCVRETIKITNEPTQYTYETIFVSFAGEELYREKGDKTSNSNEWSSLSANEDYINNGLKILTINDSINVYDPEEEKFVLVGAQRSSFIDRPSFDYQNEKYGYIIEEHDGAVSIYVYDLSEWMKPVMQYNVPTYFVEPEIFFFSDGNIVVQGAKALVDDAVSYDFIDYGYSYGFQKVYKYDLIQVVIDPAAKTAAEVEFGYKIIEKMPWNEVYFTEASKDVFVVAEIENGLINENSLKYLVTDSKLQILADLEQEFKLDEFIEEVGDNTFLLEDAVTGQLKVWKDGVVTILPADAAGEYFFNNCFVYETAAEAKIYDYKMNVLLDLTTYETFNPVAIEENYLIFTNTVTTGEPGAQVTTTTYYYFDGTLKTLGTTEDISVTVNHNRNVIEIATTTGEGADAVTTYTLYNTKMQKIADFKQSVINKTWTELDENVYMFEYSYEVPGAEPTDPAENVNETIIIK